MFALTKVLWCDKNHLCIEEEKNFVKEGEIKYFQNCSLIISVAMNRLVLICVLNNIYGLAYKTLRFIQTTLSFPLIIGLDDFCFQVLLFLSLLSCFSLFSCWFLMWKEKIEEKMLNGDQFDIQNAIHSSPSNNTWILWVEYFISQCEWRNSYDEISFCFSVSEYQGLLVLDGTVNHLPSSFYWPMFWICDQNC